MPTMATVLMATPVQSLTALMGFSRQVAKIRQFIQNTLKICCHTQTNPTKSNAGQESGAGEEKEKAAGFIFFTFDRGNE